MAALPPVPAAAAPDVGDPIRGSDSGDRKTRHCRRGLVEIGELGEADPHTGMPTTPHRGEFRVRTRRGVATRRWKRMSGTGTWPRSWTWRACAHIRAVAGPAVPPCG